MARTYSENSEPRKVYQADTIRGFTEDEVKDALANATKAAALPQNADRTKIVLSIPDADVPAILGGGNKTYYVSEDDFVKKDATVNEFPQYVAVEVPAFNIKTSTYIFYSIIFFYSGMYYLYASVSWSDVENKWKFVVYGETLE